MLYSVKTHLEGLWIKKHELYGLTWPFRRLHATSNTASQARYVVTIKDVTFNKVTIFGSFMFNSLLDCFYFYVMLKFQPTKLRNLLFLPFSRSNLQTLRKMYI